MNVKISPTQNLISMGIVDKVKPVVSISMPSSQRVITEGADYSVFLSARPRPYSPISVSLTGADQGTGHFSNLPNSGSVEIGLTGAASFNATTTSNTTKKENGQINITIDNVTANADYTVSPTLAEKKLQILIADSQPSVISIASILDGKSVVEGESFNVNLTADIEPLFPIQVALQVDDMNKGHFVSLTPGSPVTMVNTKSLAVAVTTQVASGISHGGITLSLPTPSVVSFSSDIAETPLTTPEIPSRRFASYTIHSENISVEVGIRDSAKPVVSISSNASVITEGQPFEFTLTATPTPYAPIMVDFYRWRCRDRTLCWSFRYKSS